MTRKTAAVVCIAAAATVSLAPTASAADAHNSLTPGSLTNVIDHAAYGSAKAGLFGSIDLGGVSMESIILCTLNGLDKGIGSTGNCGQGVFSSLDAFHRF